MGGNIRTYRKSRTRTITKIEVGNGESCDLFSLKETDACSFSWDDIRVLCPLDKPNTFLIDGGCYMFVDQEKTFNDAKSYCQRNRGRLFEPRTVHTNKLVSDKGFEVLNNKLWFGIITKNGKSGPWKYATSGENVVQTIWANNGQPDEIRSELCGYYHTSASYREKWFDEVCTWSLRFICEFV